MFYRFTKLIDDTNLEDLLSTEEYQALVDKRRMGLRGAAALVLSNLEIRSIKRTMKDDRLPRLTATEDAVMKRWKYERLVSCKVVNSIIYSFVYLIFDALRFTRIIFFQVLLSLNNWTTGKVCLNWRWNWVIGIVLRSSSNAFLLPALATKKFGSCTSTI